MDPITIKERLIGKGLEKNLLMVFYNGEKNRFRVAYEGEESVIFIVPDLFLSVSSKSYNRKLIEAFSSIIGYKPFVRYKDRKGFTIIEWDKHPDLRFKLLEHQQKKRDIEYLVRLGGLS